MNRLLSIFMLCLSFTLTAGTEPEKRLTPAEEAQQKRMIEEFGDFGKEYAKSSSYKKVTWSELKLSKAELENKKIQYKGTYRMFNDNFPNYIVDSGYSSKKYYYLIVQSLDIPVLVKRKDEIAKLLGKLKTGAKLQVYGRVKEFKSKDRRGMMPQYFIELASVTVLANDEEKEPEANAQNNNDNRKPNRPNKRRWK